jgi:ribosomal protein S18 acetylase RimI-like enzyme
MAKISFRTANVDDLHTIIRLLADDELGKTREAVQDKVSPEYQRAFEEIERLPNNELLVGVQDSTVIAVLQITYIPNLTLMGAKRAQIEGVRVSSSARGRGVGKLLFDFAFDRARKNGCMLVQLTTNKTRQDALRFYEKIGFIASHEGMKLTL